MRRILRPIFLLLALLLVVWRRSLSTHSKVLLLLIQELPQIPVKPLAFLTAEPVHKRLHLASPHGPIVGDLFLPARRFSVLPEPQRPAVILAFGMALHEQDRPVLLGLARTMTRLGFVVLWPRLEALDGGAPFPEEPSTFASAVRYLAGLDSVDPERISLFGFSVGASTALVAGTNPQIANVVRAVIFFGGYYDIFAYLLSAATRSFIVDGQLAQWQPSPAVLQRLVPMLEAKEADGLLRVFESQSRAEAQLRLRSAPPEELAEVGRLNPADHVERVKARLFILHDRSDSFVPYVESVKLRRALPEGRIGAFLLTDLFAHAQPRGGLSWEVVQDITRLYRFLYEALNYLRGGHK